MLHLASEIGIPAPTQETLAEYIKTKSAFRGPDGEFSPDAYTRFVDQMESNPRAPQGLVISVLEEDYRIEKVSQAISGPGYLLPSEAKSPKASATARNLHCESRAPFATFSPEITPSEEELREFYETNKLRYEIPERIKASYVFFETNSYESKAPEATDAELREHFAANRASFVAEYEAANPLPKPLKEKKHRSASP